MESRRIGFQVDALLAPEQALTLYFARAELRAPQTEYVLLEHALRRTLAEEIVSDAVYPAAARSAMDGFAVRAAETPGRLVIAGEIRMGRLWDGVLPHKAALRIPTGGALPAGADAVVPIEDVRMAEGRIEVAAAIPPGDCVTPAGSDMRAGETLLRPGRRIGGAELGVLATLGIASVAVHRRPIVAVISSGDELVEIAAEPTAAQLRDSNRWAVAGTLEALGAAVRHLPTSPDDPIRLEAILREATATCDAVVLTGGSSVGERDFTPEIIGQLGAPGVIVHGLRVKPGKPTVLASVGGKPVIGLPGNPASALLILEAVAAPIFCSLSGSPWRRAGGQARLAQEVRKRAGWTWFLPVRVDEAGADCAAYPLELRSSSVSLLARASGFLVLDETIESLPAGTPVAFTRFLVGGA
jgi:molybdenum cofactor synthesis domain-containing protein